MLLTRSPRGVCFVLLSIGVILAGSNSFALQSPPGKPINLNHSQERLPIAQNAEVVCDASGNMTLAAAQAASFIALRPGMLTSDNCAGYWIRFAVEVEGPDSQNWVLQLLHPWWNADLYLESASGISEERTGIALPPQGRALISGNTAVPVLVMPGASQVFYLHLIGDTSKYGESRTLDANFIP